MMPAVNYFGFCIMWEMKKFDFYFISTKRENVSTANQSKMECKRDLDMDAWSVAVLKVLILFFSVAFSFSSIFGINDFLSIFSISESNECVYLICLDVCVKFGAHF